MQESDRLFDALAEAAENDVPLDQLEMDMWKRFGQTCAVMVLDATGFSRTTQKKGIVFYLACIARMRKVAARIFEEKGASDWRAEADNLYARFDTPDQALAASFAIHRALRKARIMIDDDEAFSVSIGIGYGRLLRSDWEGMYGDEMNLASKLGEDAGDSGETLLTEDALTNLTEGNNVEAHRRFVTVSGVELPYFIVYED